MGEVAEERDGSPDASSPPHRGEGPGERSRRANRYIVRGQRVAVAKLERAREFRREMTAEEALLWNALRSDKLAGLHFRRQQVIDGFIVDFYCHSAALVVEVDGMQHQAQADYDRERDRILAARQLRVLRVSAREVRADLGVVLDRIADAAGCES